MGDGYAIRKIGSYGQAAVSEAYRPRTFLTLHFHSDSYLLLFEGFFA
jgi:hypothetical protein